jgi:hypothetical protein
VGEKHEVMGELERATEEDAQNDDEKEDIDECE